ncbi:glycosyltransferase [Gracilibacillus phocaeensis]|uniref:glycosyltransferase n=1 Tax=Gracilibacillus phocaeensis TaxID=2042304 RepID=UPI0010304834|nr:glycosyltransferase [Gracilibacillus phocaeensis]
MSQNITVLMSVYNDEKYLAESIESVLNQTFEDFEFLIIDDASTDNTSKIIADYEKRDSRIRVISNKENKGLSYNLAEGINIAKTELIARMDADDISKVNRLEKQYNYIKENTDTDIVGSFVTDINEDGQELELRKVPVTHEEIAKLIWTCPFIHPTVLFKKEAIQKAGSYDRKLRRRQDYDLWFRCQEIGLRFANLSESLLLYRVTDEYFKKNNIKVQFQQAKMGFKGAKKINASLIAYIGIIIAFLKGILPYRIRKPINNLLKNVDPRRS